LGSAGADNTVRLWNVESGESRVLLGHTAPVFDLAFSPTGKEVATGSGDGTVRVWEVLAPPAATRERMDELTDYGLTP